MSNHFHLLREVPQAKSSLRLSYSIASKPATAERAAKPLDQEVAYLRQEPEGADQIQRLLQPYRNYLFVHGSLHTKSRRPAFDLATAQTVTHASARRLGARSSCFNAHGLPVKTRIQLPITIWRLPV